MGFSKKIKEFFEIKGLSNRDVARIMDNYNEQLVGRYVNSDEISKTFLKKIKKYFPDADINYLISEEDEDIINEKNVVQEPGAEYNPIALQLVIEIEDRLAQLKNILAQNCHQK